MTAPSTAVPPFMVGPATTGAPKVTRDDMTIGSPVFVIQSSYRRGQLPQAIQGWIVSAARVWCEIECLFPSGLKRTFRLRLDDQTDGSNSFYATRWRTPAQHEWHEAYRSAEAFLSDQGIHVERGSRWNDPTDRIELARLVWPHRRVTA